MKTVKGRVMEKVATPFWSAQLGFWEAMRLVTWRAFRPETVVVLETVPENEHPGHRLKPRRLPGISPS